VALAIVAGALAFIILLRAGRTQQAAPVVPQADVVVARNDIEIRQLVQAEDVGIISVPLDVVPGNAARSTSEVLGYLARHRLYSGEVILTSDVVSPTFPSGDLGLTMEPDKVAMAVPAEDLMSRYRLLKPGDHVDLMFSIEVKLSAEDDEAKLVTIYALQNLEVSQIVEQAAAAGGTADVTDQKQPVALVFALDPQDALTVKHLLDMNGIVDIVLRAPDRDGRFDTQPVDVPYLIDRYQLRVPILP
jgi:Flp pilus assembly protein CpaB